MLFCSFFIYIYDDDDGGSAMAILVLTLAFSVIIENPLMLNIVTVCFILCDIFWVLKFDSIIKNYLF